jgi:hypothetical protein
MFPKFIMLQPFLHRARCNVPSHPLMQETENPSLWLVGASICQRRGKNTMLYRFASEMLSEFVEDLSKVESFAVRSKSALFFKSLLSLCSELARRLGLHA